MGEGKNEGEKGIQLYNIFTHGFYSNYPVKCWAKLGEEKVMRVSASSTRGGRENDRSFSGSLSTLINPACKHFAHIFPQSREG